MPLHDHFHRRHPRALEVVEEILNKREVSTIYEVVYTTAPATFEGEIGGYTTLGVEITAAAPSTTSPTPAPATTPKPASSSTPVAAQVKSSAPNTSKTTLATSASSLPGSIQYSSTTIPSSVAIVAASGKVSSSAVSSHASGTSNAAASAANASSSSSSTASASASSTDSAGGMSTAGKAGLAIGILLLLGAVLALVLICIKKKRKEAKNERAEDEKHEFANIERHMSTRTTATTATAPRLSLRPVTQFLPNLTVKRASHGNDLLTVTENGKAWEMDRPTTAQSEANNPENPFGNHAQTQPTNQQNPFGNHAETQPTNQENPFGNHAETIQPLSPIDATNANGPEIVQDANLSGEIIAGAAVGGAAPAAAVVATAPGLKRGASKRENGPSPLDFTKSGPFMGPPSPSGTEFSMSSEAGNNTFQTGTSAAIAAAGGPANTAVHRVQLDFKPSMDDELELRAGQLIRLLHEYDDGWALCIRLDRSRQGVVPRTCLSTRPVKPRPQQNGPRGPNMRGQGPPHGNFQRPMTPNGPLMTPTGPLPSTPDGRHRSPPHSQPNSPPEHSHMNSTYEDADSHQYSQRKPVPGQAL